MIVNVFNTHVFSIFNLLFGNFFFHFLFDTQGVSTSCHFSKLFFKFHIDFDFYLLKIHDGSFFLFRFDRYISITLFLFSIFIFIFIFSVIFNVNVSVNVIFIFIFLVMDHAIVCIEPQNACITWAFQHYPFYNHVHEFFYVFICFYDRLTMKKKTNCKI